MSATSSLLSLLLLSLLLLSVWLPLFLLFDTKGALPPSDLHLQMGLRSLARSKLIPDFFPAPFEADALGVGNCPSLAGSSIVLLCLGTKEEESGAKKL